MTLFGMNIDDLAGLYAWSDSAGVRPRYKASMEAVLWLKMRFEQSGKSAPVAPTAEHRERAIRSLFAIVSDLRV